MLAQGPLQDMTNSRQKLCVRVSPLGKVAFPLLLGVLGCGANGGAQPGGTGGGQQRDSAVGVGGTSGTGGTAGQGGTIGSVGGQVGDSGVGGRSGGAGGQASGGGGTAGTAGFSGKGGAAGNSGTNGTGGATGKGGAPGTGGIAGSGGMSGSGGASTDGGAAGKGGTTGAGGTGVIGGTGGNGGTIGTGGSSTGGSTSTGPCDIYTAANTPCVSAHSTVRALYGAYNGKLYQVRRASDSATQDIKVGSAGGYADTSVQDSFCKGATCTISIIYDQSPQGNDLKKSGVAHWLSNGGNESSATAGKATVNGHTVYGIYVTSSYAAGNDIKDVAYRNNNTKGMATGNQAESMYMVVDGKRYSDLCCFDYGNASTTGNDEGNGTMEAVYFGTDTGWGGYGLGNGPWIAADLENGIFKGDDGSYLYGDTHKTPWPTAKSVVANYATAMLKGPDTNHFTLKGGDAQSGTLSTMWDSDRPKKTPPYSPKQLQGAIILGTGGDGSNTGTGTFFEGAITIGNPPDSADDAVQANIVAAGYGH
jgi:hypothetical protein